MKTSDRGTAFIAAQEGIVTRAYRDVAGNWTIGAGHTAAAGEPKPVRGMTMTRDEALAVLARVIAKCEPRVASALGVGSQTAFDGGVSFDFNTGAIDRASWVAAFRDGNVASARAGLMEWNRAGGRVVAGLVSRRNAEAALIFGGDYGDKKRPVAEAAPSDDTTSLQRDLAALGFYAGPRDGIASQALTSAVAAYQKSHPDLVTDGIAGPATRASIARDRAARRAAGTYAGSAAAAIASAGIAAHAGAAHALAVGGTVMALLVVVAAALLVLRWGDEFRRAVTSTTKDR
jgi:lysozyme